MENNILEEYNKYLLKAESSSIKETWVIKNLPLLYDYIKDKKGDTLSEKIYLIDNEKEKCKICNSDVKFLSIKRGYRDYCSKKCSNNDKELTNKKISSYKQNNLEKYGVDNPSKTKKVKEKISKSKKGFDYTESNEKFKKTCIERYGVDNPSKVKEFKLKKEKTNLINWGVKNVFSSDEIKDKIKSSLLSKYGVESPLKSNILKEKYKKTLLSKYGVDNYTKSNEYKELIYSKYTNKEIKTNLNQDPNYDIYIGIGKHQFKCDDNLNHKFITNSHLYHSRKGKSLQCTICNPVRTSYKKNEVFEFIEKNYKGEIIQSYRNGLEIDIYLPHLKLGFEFNGLYWHNELNKNKNYHIDKTNYFNKKGIRIIHIWEDDWDFKKDIIKSQILNWIIKTPHLVYARKCIIKEIVNIKEYKDFLNNNHIQGFTSASLKLGLYYKNKIVSIMTFDHFEGRKKMNVDEWNLSRFCNIKNTNVIGGASKLLNYFIKKYKPKRIISFSDKSWSKGELYNKLGFSIKYETKPNYQYIIDKRRSKKQKWKKSKLVKMGLDSDLSEKQIMEKYFNSYRIWDCGQIKHELML